MSPISNNTMNHLYGNQLRVRISGICIQNEYLLLVKHQGLGKKGYVWMPPGGGLHFGETATDCLTREFKEETGLHIRVKDFLFVHEFLGLPLHAIELFFEVAIESGQLIKGKDPEMNAQDQIIEQVAFMSAEAIHKEKKGNLHQVLNLCEHPSELLTVHGYFKTI